MTLEGTPEDKANLSVDRGDLGSLAVEYWKPPATPSLSEVPETKFAQAQTNTATDATASILSADELAKGIMKEHDPNYDLDYASKHNLAGQKVFGQVVNAILNAYQKDNGGVDAVQHLINDINEKIVGPFGPAVGFSPDNKNVMLVFQKIDDQGKRIDITTPISFPLTTPITNLTKPAHESAPPSQEEMTKALNPKQ